MRNLNARRKLVRTSTAIFVRIDYVWPAYFVNYKTRAQWGLWENSFAPEIQRLTAKKVSLVNNSNDGLPLFGVALLVLFIFCFVFVFVLVFFCFPISLYTSSYFGLSMMDGKAFDIWLIPEFSGAITDMPIVEWIENVELVSELCAVDIVECILPLRLWGGALAMYGRLSKKQMIDAKQIKQAIITAYATDKSNAQCLHSRETVHEFLVDLHRLDQLAGEPLPDWWMTCAFTAELPQHVRKLLRWTQWTLSSFWPGQELSWQMTEDVRCQLPHP